MYTHTCHIFFKHSCTDRYLHCFCISAIINKADINIGVHVPFQISEFIFTGRIPRVELLDHMTVLSFLGGSVVKKLPAMQESWVQSLGRSPVEWNGYPLQHSCLGNPMDRGAWRATVCGVTESGTWRNTDNSSL